MNTYLTEAERSINYRNKAAVSGYTKLVGYNAAQSVNKLNFA